MLEETTYIFESWATPTPSPRHPRIPLVTDGSCSIPVKVLVLPMCISVYWAKVVLFDTCVFSRNIARRLNESISRLENHRSVLYSGKRRTSPHTGPRSCRSTPLCLIGKISHGRASSSDHVRKCPCHGSPYTPFLPSWLYANCLFHPLTKGH